MLKENDQMREIWVGDNFLYVLRVVEDSTAQIHNKSAVVERFAFIYSRERQRNVFSRGCEDVVAVSFLAIDFLKAI